MSYHKKSAISAVQWFEGMILSPQHLQFSDSLHQQYAYNLLCMQNDFVYGICTFAYDKAELVRGILRVRELKGIFPDGLIFDIDEDIVFLLKDAVQAKALVLHVAIAKHISGKDNMSRFTSHSWHDVGDENTGQHMRDVPVLKPKLRIVEEKQLRGSEYSMPLAKVYMSETGLICVDEFIGPRISVTQEHSIMKMHHELLEMIYAKKLHIAHKNSNIDAAQDAVYLRCLSQAYVLLDSVSYVNRIHPFDLYKCWANAFAMLCGMNVVTEYATPRYQHDHITAVFKDMFGQMEQVLSCVQVLFYTEKFVYASGVYKYEYVDFSGDILVGIKKPSVMSDDEFLRWVDGLQICSESMLFSVRHQRTLGAERKILSKTNAFSPPAGTVLLSIKRDASYIKVHEALCISHTKECPEIEMISYHQR